MQHSYSSVLALDVGTSGTRAAVFDAQGGVKATYSVAYRAAYGANGFAELDAEEILEAVVRVMTECLREAGPADCISPGTFMHSLILTDANFKPLTPLSIWADRRAAPECERARPLYVKENRRARTGCPLSPSYPLYRLLWYREHEPELFGAFARALSIKSFLLARLIGVPVEDFSSAAGSGLFNLRDRTWDADILASAGLSSDKLPEVQDGRLPINGPTPGDGLSADFQRLVGGAAWLPGGADGPLAHLAGAGRSSDTMSLSIGTSMAARIGVPEGEWPGRRRSSDTWCYVLDGDMLVEGIAGNNGGNVLEWYVREHYPGGRLEDESVVAAARHRPELICLSELHRDRAQDEETLGFVLKGVRPEHTADEKLRAVVEGMTFQAVAMATRLSEGRAVKRIILSGSLTASPLVREILESLLAPEIFRAGGRNDSLEGARMLALEWSEPRPMADALQAEARPAAERPDYRAKYERWRRIRAALVQA